MQTVNQINGTRIVAGDSLVVPRTTDLSLLANYNRARRSGRRILPKPNEYIVRNGDNLWSIARKFDLRSAKIASWNNIGIESVLQPGQELNLEFSQNQISPSSEISISASAKDYRVRRGDSMHGIANKFSIAISDLLNWNDMDSNDLIFPGQLIRITPLEINLN